MSKTWFITGTSRGFGREWTVAAVFSAVQRGHEHFGRLDVVVNNAGCGQSGTIEELSEGELRAQIETSVFGALWVTASRPSRTSAPTTPRSGRSRASARRWPPRSRTSASR